MKKVKAKVLNYRVLIEPDERTGTNEPCFTAYCPTLDIADEGDTIEEALVSIKEGIECRIEALMKQGEPVPPGDEIGETVVVTSAKVSVPKNYPIAFA